MFKLGIAISFYVATEMLIASRLVFYVNEFWHYELDQASSFLSIYFLLLLAGRLFFSFFTVPVKAINLLKGSLLVTIIFYLLGMYVHPYFLVAAGLSMSFFFPTMVCVSVHFHFTSTSHFLIWSNHIIF